MNDNFFNEFVLSIVIDKKYLTEEQFKIESSRFKTIHNLRKIYL